jgi:hypothetical protein
MAGIFQTDALSLPQAAIARIDKANPITSVSNWASSTREFLCTCMMIQHEIHSSFAIQSTERPGAEIA